MMDCGGAIGFLAGGPCGPCGPLDLRPAVRSQRRVRMCVAAKSPSGLEVTVEGLPVVGCLLDILYDPVKFYVKNFDKHGDTFRFRVANRTAVALRGTRAAELVLGEGVQKGLVTSTNGFSATMESLLGTSSILFSDHAPHRQLRKLMAPPFAKTAIARQAEEVERLTAVHLRETFQPGLVPLKGPSKRLAFETMMSCLIGIRDLDEMASLYDLFRQFERGLMSFGWDLPGTRYRNARNARDELKAIIVREVRKRTSELRDLPVGAPRPFDSMTLLIDSRDEEGNGLSEEELVVQVLGVMFAGHETSGAAIVRATQALCSPENAEVLRRLQDEVGDVQVPTTLKELKALPYLHMVFLELLRLWGPIQAVPRRVLKDFDFDGIHIRRGERVIVHTYCTHMKPDLYPDPHTFRPERFADMPEPPQSLMTAFGAGKHYCLGKPFAELQVKLYIVRLVQLTMHSNISLVPGQNLGRAGFSIINLPANEIRVQFEPNTA